MVLVLDLEVVVVKKFSKNLYMNFVLGIATVLVKNSNNGSSQRCPLFLRTLSFKGTTKQACKFINLYRNPIFKIEYSSTQFTLLIL